MQIIVHKRICFSRNLCIIFAGIYICGECDICFIVGISDSTILHCHIEIVVYKLFQIGQGYGCTYRKCNLSFFRTIINMFSVYAIPSERKCILCYSEMVGFFFVLITVYKL